jgi:hypothetical protein
MMSSIPPSPQPVLGQPTAPGAGPQRSWFARHKVLTALGVVVVLGIGAAALGGGGGDGDGTADTPVVEQTTGGEEPAAEEPAAEEPAPAGIGTPVTDDGFEFVVTGVEPGVARVGSDLLGQDAQGQFVLVHLTATNVGTEAAYLYTDPQKATDAQGREFTSDITATAYAATDMTVLSSQVNPGNQATLTLVYDIPADTALTAITLHGGIFSDGVTVTLG